jgi:hypothetical protein
VKRPKKKIWLASGIVLFAAYFFCAARPIPLETVLEPRWLNSLEFGQPVVLGDSPAEPGGGEQPGEAGLVPFELGDRFGYFHREGRFVINRTKRANISLSLERWAEYEAEPERVAINDASGEAVFIIENPRGYPFFLDGRTFLVNSEQNAISEVDSSGSPAWTYEFASPLTCVDAASGLVLAGSLDGVVGVLDSTGKQMFSFEPGGSRYSIILGCAISRDGSKLALVSGIDNQRFLLLERFGASVNDYKVVYHEFLDGDFRRPVHISFIDEDRWIVFERHGGLGLFELGSWQSGKVELNGDLCAIDQADSQGLLFAVVARSPGLKELIGIRLPGRLVMEAPFRSEEVFLGRYGSRLFVGGKQALVAFDLEKR